MRVLIACEFSGVVRDAFIAAGHDAVSCDLMPSEKPGPHITGNVTQLLNDSWDLMIAHPPCTYICNSGVRWLHSRPGRWELLNEAKIFFNLFLNSDIEKIAIENPIPHKYAELPKYTQIIQPWQFGHGETKKTCLWLKNLPLLAPSDIVDGRFDRIHRMSPSKHRSQDRSRTYQGIADAMADQWG